MVISAWNRKIVHKSTLLFSKNVPVICLPSASLRMSCSLSQNIIFRVKVHYFFALYLHVPTFLIPNHKDQAYHDNRFTLDKNNEKRSAGGGQADDGHTRLEPERKEKPQGRTADKRPAAGRQLLGAHVVTVDVAADVAEEDGGVVLRHSEAREAAAAHLGPQGLSWRCGKTWGVHQAGSWGFGAFPAHRTEQTIFAIFGACQKGGAGTPSQKVEGF